MLGEAFIFLNYQVGRTRASQGTKDTMWPSKEQVDEPGL